MKRKEEKKIRKLYYKRSRSLQCCVRYMRASARSVLCCVRTAICSTNLVVSCRTIQCPLHCRIAWISLFDSLLLAASVVAVAEVLRCSFHFRSDHFRWNTLIFFRSRFVFRFVCSAAALVSERGCHSVRYGVRDSTYHNGFCDQWIFCVYAFSLNELKQHFLRERASIAFCSNLMAVPAADVTMPCNANNMRTRIFVLFFLVRRKRTQDASYYRQTNNFLRNWKAIRTIERNFVLIALSSGSKIFNQYFCNKIVFMDARGKWFWHRQHHPNKTIQIFIGSSFDFDYVSPRTRKNVVNMYFSMKCGVGRAMMVGDREIVIAEIA